uniref:CASP-like protein n=1 Tax=Aegilops tauschii TaxID=37682 RepID=N1R548_AEGTA
MRGPWTRCSLVFRLLQAAFAATSLAVMASTDDFSSVTTFRYLVAAAIVQCLWSLAVAILDAYAIVVKRSFRTARAVIILALGDWDSMTSFYYGGLAGLLWDELRVTCVELKVADML